MTAVLLASLALMLGHQPMLHESPRAERATGRTVLCMSKRSSHHLAVVWKEKFLKHGWGEADYWVPSAHVILLHNEECHALAHPFIDKWETVPGVPVTLDRPRTVANAIFALGHEAAHARQQDLGLPFSEHQANCWSKAGFQSLRHRLGIQLSITWADTGQSFRC